MMLRDFFLPQGFEEPLSNLPQHESYTRSGLIYESAQLSSPWLAQLLKKFRRAAFGFKKGSKAWQARAVKAWCRAAEEWKTLKFPGAKTFLASLSALTGFSEKMLKEALYNHFVVFDEEVFRKWLNGIKRERDEQPEYKVNYPSLAFIVAAGNIPGVAIHPVIHLSLLGIPTLVKSASTEPLLLPVILETLARHDAEVAARIAAFTWPRSNAELTQTVMAHHPALVAFGDDETMGKFLLQKKRFVDFGDRFCLTLVHPASAKSYMRRIAYDICMFEQMGCLSPQAILLFTDDWKQIDKFCQQLAKAMAKMSVRLPVSKRTMAQQALIQQWRGAFVARGGAGEKIIMLASAGTDWTIAAAAVFGLDERVAYRFARVWPISSMQEFVEIFRRYRNKVHLLIWGSSLHELEKFWNAPEWNEEFKSIPFNLAGQAQAPNCGWLEDVNPAWRRLMRGLRVKTVKDK
jgi:hypothetical protein